MCTYTHTRPPQSLPKAVTFIRTQIITKGDVLKVLDFNYLCWRLFQTIVDLLAFVKMGEYGDSMNNEISLGKRWEPHPYSFFILFIHSFFLYHIT